MYKIGEAFCIHCFEVNKRFIYKIPDKNIYVEIKKNILNEYRVSHFFGDEFLNAEVLERHKVEEINNLGLPFEIFVRIKFPNNEEKKYILNASNRVCEHCLKRGVIRNLPVYGGYLPQILLVNAGDTQKGKTAFVNAMKHSGAHIFEQDNLIPVERFLGGKVVLEATRLSDRDQVSEFVMLGEDRQPYLSVLECDVPGELFGADRTVNQTDNYRYFYELISLADVVFLFMDDNSIPYIKKNNSNIQDMSQLLSLLSGQFRDKPLAVILSKSDRIKEDIDKMVFDNEKNLINKEYPWFHQIDVRKNTDLSMLLEVNRKVVRDLVPVLKTLINEDRRQTAYFMVSSGTPIDGNPNELDYRKSINVHLPIIWCLKQVLS